MKKSEYCILDYDKKRKKYSEYGGWRSPFEVGIPLVDMSNKTVEQIYYFRWHTYCKHIKPTEDGYVITEFLPDVPWSGKHNTICCSAGHHFYEGRWLYNRKYLSDYAEFWFTEGAKPRLYSFWSADSILALCKVTGDLTVARELYNGIKNNWLEWEKTNMRECGLFYQIDDRDGMEFSVSGNGYRPTINSYMCGDALAISQIARLLGKEDESGLFYDKYSKLKELINTKLWNADADFYMTLAENGNYGFSGVREEIGYIPWYFNIPDDEKTAAWRFLNDEKYFKAPFGPTTVEKNHPEFMREHPHDCLWNGSSWPFATSQTLTALGNLISNYNQTLMKKSDYYDLVDTYAKSQYLNGEPFIDENIDPFTGAWAVRERLHSQTPLPDDAERGKDYNHSTFCDLVIGGLAGVRPSLDSTVTVNPLFGEDDLEYFCADGILYHGHYITVVWDKTGERYNKGRGLTVLCNGETAGTMPVPSAVKFSI